jgi:hypothetical protein
MFILLISLGGLVAAEPAHPAPAGYGYAPEFYCRDTNTSIYAEVCVPAFREQITPVTLAVKEVIDNDYCFEEVLTVCEETSQFVDREICTYEYAREDVSTDCTTTQVTYAEKSETMKVTTCSPSGYGTPGYGHGEHQYCREEYQTQMFKVPLVSEPKAEMCKLAYPAPKKVCVNKNIEITEVKCEDKIATKCFNVAKFMDATNTVDQKEVIIAEEPSCQQLTLTLPTQACTKHHEPAPYHG